MKTSVILPLFLLALLSGFSQKPKQEVKELKVQVLDITSGPFQFAYGSISAKVGSDTSYFRFPPQYGALMVSHFKPGSQIEMKAKVYSDIPAGLRKEILLYFFQNEILTVKVNNEWVTLEEEPRREAPSSYKVFLNKKIKEEYFRESYKCALFLENDIVTSASPAFIRENGMKGLQVSDKVSFIGYEMPRHPGYTYPAWNPKSVYSFIRLYEHKGHVTSLLYKQNYACIGLVLRTSKETLKFSFPVEMGKEIKQFVEAHSSVTAFADNYKIENQLAPPELHALVSEGDTLKIERFGFYGGEDTKHEHRPAAVEGKISTVNKSDKGKTLSFILGNDCYIEVDYNMEKQLGSYLRKGTVIKVDGLERIKKEGEVYSKEYRIITPRQITAEGKTFLVNMLPE